MAVTQDFMEEEEAERLEGLSLGKVRPRRGLTLGRSFWMRCVDGRPCS